MLSSDDQALGFQQYYIQGSSGSVVLAAKLTEANIKAFEKVVQGEAVYDEEDKVWRLVFSQLQHRNMPNDVAELGDFVIADMGGLYLPMEKELFEDNYSPWG